MINELSRTLLRSTWIAADDIQASVSGPDLRYARRFSLDVAEEALERLAPMVVQHIAERLGEHVVHHHEPMIEQAVLAYLQDRAWAEPIIRQAIQDSVRTIITEIFTARRETCPPPILSACWRSGR